ncbi:NAD-dependent succinate-semialdehyde dehydrogenase [Paenarthrobacter sp. NPDC090522]|uniref:NAD-dependent succinate-semialdehyde dehydrogenase n=1 Tax=Paenarthrobacter sp. NPDC090522 TaxID=3364383 RepID=UPI003809626C
MLKPYETELLGRVEPGFFIDGRWERPDTRELFNVHDPSTGEIIKSVASATVEDALRALDAAAGAQQTWASTPSRVRSNILRRAFDLLTARKEDFALLISLEMGKPLAEARDEVDYGAEFLRWFSEEAVRVRGDYRPTPEGTGTIVVTHRPVGPTYVITPWNYPLAMATRKMAPALAAGCTVVVKPAELTPLTTNYFAQLLAEAGVPAGVVNVVPTSDPAAQSQALLADARLRKISFTGSTAVGTALMATAATNALRTSMELGGNAPFVVFEDADLDNAVQAVVLAKFRNTGQACTAANRVIVHDSIADDFVERLSKRVNAMKVGRGTEAGVEVGLLITPKARDNVSRLVEDALNNNATLVTGGKPLAAPGNFFQPTVIDRVPPNAALMNEEIFGPVLGIFRFTAETEAVELANKTPFGLVGYVFTEDLHRGHRMINSIDTGMMGLNVGAISNAAAPFGGIKLSGLGREGGFEGIHEYLSPKYTLLPHQR